MNRFDTIEALLAGDGGEEDRIDDAEGLRGSFRAAKITMDRVRKALDVGWDPFELREQ